MSHPMFHSEPRQASFSASQLATFARWTQRRPHWETELTSNAGHIDPSATPSQIMRINIPDYFLTNSGARNIERLGGLPRRRLLCRRGVR